MATVSSARVVAALIIVLSTRSYGTSLPFEAAPNYSTGAEPLSVCVGDFNGDDHPDLATVNRADTTVSVLLNDQSGGYVAAAELTVGGLDPRAIVAALLDGDEHVDLAVACSGSNEIRVFLGVGDGSFVLHANYVVGTEPWDIAVADVDMDEDTDLLVVNRVSNDVSVLQNDGSGAFPVRTDYVTGTEPWALVCVPLDAGPSPDLAVAHYGNGRVSVLLNTGDGTYSPGTDYSAASKLTDITCGDFDRDGDFDLAVTAINLTSWVRSVRVLDNAGDGTFGSPTIYLSGTGVERLVSADFDGDQNPDIAALSPDDLDSRVFLLRNDGMGVFTENPGLPIVPSPYDLASDDADRDQDMDLVISALGPSSNGPGRVQVLENAGNGTFVTYGRFSTGGYPYSVVAGDLDGDGDIDLATADWGSSVSILPNRGDGTFDPAWTYPGPQSNDIAAADFDEDGDVDLTVTNYHEDTVAIYLNYGDGTFAPRVAYGVSGEEPTSVCTADLDGDGDADLAVTHYMADAVFTYAVALLFNNGDGTFAPAIDYRLTGVHGGITPCDVDGDGDIDLLAISDSSLDVRLNDGSGGFPFFATDTYTEVGGVAIWTSDIDLDGDPDVLGVDSSDRTLWVMTNVGDGLFVLDSQYPLEWQPTSVAIRDLDCDVAPEVVVCGYAEVVLFHNDGTGALQRTNAYGTVYASSLVSTDLDGDIDWDLVTVGGGAAGAASVLRNLGEYGSPPVLSGVVTDHSGEPLPGATVQASLAGFVGTAVSDGQGQYVMNLPPGTYTVVAEAGDYLREVHADVALRCDETIVVDFALGQILASDPDHPPHHLTAWTLGESHDISWECVPQLSPVENVSIEFRADIDSAWTTLATGLPPVGEFAWLPQGAADVSTAFAELRFTAYDSTGTSLGTRLGDTFALYRDTDVLIRPDRHVFAWPDAQVPPGTASYRLDFATDGQSSCHPPQQVHRETSAPTPYYQFLAQDWDTLQVDKWAYRVIALDGSGGSLGEVESEHWVLLCDLEQGGGLPNSPPVILVHGWTSDRTIWTQDNQIFQLLEGAGFGPWTLEYPSVGDARDAAAGLARSLDFVLADQPVGARASLIAHSFGGLVSRAYIQGLARFKSEIFLYAENVGHLVTLGTPHQGTPATMLMTLYAAYWPENCGGIPGFAITQMDNRFPWPPTAGPSAFLNRINDLDGTPLDGDCRHLFIGGYATALDDLSGLGDAGKASVLAAFGGVNDGAVPIASALASDLVGIPNYLCQTYADGHGPLARCGLTGAKETSLVAFLLDQPTVACIDPVVRALSGTARFLASPAKGLWVRIYRLGTGIPESPRRLQAKRLGEDEYSSFWLSSTDARGRFVIPYMPTGTYRFVTDGLGAIDHETYVTVDSTASGWSMEIGIEDDGSYSGPSNAWIEIAEGAYTIADSVAAVTVSAENAVDMIVSERPDFLGANWTLLTSPFEWTFSGTPGHKVIYAKVRDGAGAESYVLSDEVHLAGPIRGELLVVTDPPGSAVYVNGQEVSDVSPALITGLEAGVYIVTVDMRGARPVPAIQEVSIAQGSVSEVDFVFVDRQPPIDFELSYPSADAWSTSQTPTFVWTPSGDPEEGSAVLYEVQVSRDTTFTELELDVAGVSDTSFAPSDALQDSSTYAWRVDAVTMYGLRRGASEPFRVFRIDATPPAISVLEPSDGDVWAVGDSVVVHWSAADWGGISSLSVGLSVDAGATFVEIGEPGPADTLWGWTVPDTLDSSQECVVRVSGGDVAGNQGSSTSEGLFSILSPTAIQPDLNAHLPPVFLGPPLPNPMRGTCAFRARAQSDVATDLSIFDVAGRLVHTLYRGPVGFGDRVFTIGADRSRRLAAGVYFVRLTTGETMTARSLVVVR
jgi:pimeloyl-ACP methyl ester carboxylesterase